MTLDRTASGHASSFVRVIGSIAAACVSAGDMACATTATTGIGVGTPGTATDVLLRAVQGRVGQPDMGAASVERSWTWRVPRAEPVLVWATCRGRGDTRACVIAFARVGPAGLRMLGEQPVGWSVPGVGESNAGGEELVIDGDDGRGTWRQLVRYERDGTGVITFLRRQYAAGF